MMKLNKSDLIDLTWHKSKPWIAGVQPSKDMVSRVLNIFLEILRQHLMDCDAVIDIQKLMSFTPVWRQRTRAWSFKEKKVVDRKGRMEIRVDLAREIKDKVREADDTQAT